MRKLWFLAVLTCIAVNCEASALIVEQEVPSYIFQQNEPPPDHIETIPEIPGSDYIWLKGHWIWKNEWVWAEGRWAKKPHSDALFEPAEWKRKQNHWVFVPGFWK